MNNQKPFLDVKSFVTEEVSQEPVVTSTPLSSPFLSLYGSKEEEGGLIDPEAEEYLAFLNELYDEEFDEALSALVDEAAAIYETQFLHEQEDPQTIGYQAERLLDQHFAPLVAEAEAMFEALAREFSQRDPNTLTEDEIETIVDRYQPSIELTPSFEDFWGKLKKAVKKVAKKAVTLAKKGISAVAKLGLGPILRKLKALIKPLLKRVIRFAIGKLPPYLQPIALLQRSNTSRRTYRWMVETNPYDNRLSPPQATLARTEGVTNRARDDRVHRCALPTLPNHAIPTGVRDEISPCAAVRVHQRTSTANGRTRSSVRTV